MTTAAMNTKHTVSVTMTTRSTARGADASITITTPAEDRMGDVVVPEGGDFTDYERNPVVLFGHDHYALPIGRTVALKTVPGAGIRADFTWLTNDPIADRVRNAFEQNVLNAASIGFLPVEWEPYGKNSYRFTKWQLLEWSIVPVPANPEAVRTLKQFGLDAPVPVIRAALTLDALSAALKAGRVLSRVNDERLRHASALLDDVLSQLDDGPDDDEKSVAAVQFGANDDDAPIRFNDDGTITMSERTLNDVIENGIDAHIIRLTGRIPDPPAPKLPGGDVPIYLTDDELTELVTEALNRGLTDAFNKMLGRVD